VGPIATSSPHSHGPDLKGQWRHLRVIKSQPGFELLGRPFVSYLAASPGGGAEVPCASN
jgi:hypothetical protein